MKLLQVVPALPPRLEGIGGYALALATTLRSRGIETIFSCEHTAAVDFEVEGLRSPARSLPTLLHYANYGYHRHGLPRDLVEGVATERESGAIPRLAIFFHEFLASGRPWNRTFWTTRIQRRLARRLTGVADSGLTTIPIYADLLRDLAPQLSVRCLAMPSPVGEPPMSPPWTQRAGNAIVFGGPGNRGMVYSALGRTSVALSAIGVRTILDVGPGAQVAPSRIGDVPIEVRGEMAAADLSALLLDTRLGFSAYPADFLGKSTAFAALAAHGVPCLALRGPSIALVDAPCVLPQQAHDQHCLEIVGQQVRAWYRKHDLATHAAATLTAVGLGE